MNVQVEQSIVTRLMQNGVHTKTGPPVTTPVDRIDFDTMYGVAIIGMIWGGFFALFWYM